MLALVERMNNSVRVAWLYVAIGCVLFMLLIYFSVTTYLFLSEANSTLGVVVELSQRDGSYYPVVNYESEQGPQKFASSFGCKPACYKIGEQIDVLYINLQNQKPIIDSFASKYGPMLLFAATSIGFIGGGLFNLKRLKHAT